MMIPKKLSLLLCLLGLVTAAACAADQPRVLNAKLETRSAANGLEHEFHSLVQNQKQPAWIGYAAPVVPGNHQMCCCDSSRMGVMRGGCALEGNGSFTMNSSDSKQVDLEGPDHFWILFRVAENKIDKIRTYSADCELNAGGLPFFWLTDVKPAESVALLSSFVSAEDDEERDGEKLTESAIAAIALTADASADSALDRLVAANQPESLRKKVTFWLGAARGKHGFETLRRLVREDPDDRFREHAIFGVSVSKEPEALATLIDLAKNDKASRVRSQALFWLAQKAGQRAVQTINDAIENDPETEVKKRAVFALSQIPRGEGVPLLIQVARTNRNREVRKQAMFWLGQSNDPRAAAFFEEVLLR
jgi:ribosomal protein S7